jgi:prophage tail gpP-like protein
MAARAGLEAARSAWPSVDASVTVAGWIRPDGKLWGITDNVSVYSPMGLPNGTGRMTLGVQAITYSQVHDADGEGTTTTMELKKPELLTSTPHADVRSDGSGGYGDASGTPAAAQPVPPDYSAGSVGPGGLLGHV